MSVVDDNCTKFIEVLTKIVDENEGRFEVKRWVKIIVN